MREVAKGIVHAYVDLLKKGGCDYSPDTPCRETEAYKWFFMYVGDDSLWQYFLVVAKQKGAIRPW